MTVVESVVLSIRIAARVAADAAANTAGARAAGRASGGLGASTAEAAIGGAAGDLFQTATDEATWDRGISEMFAVLLAAIARGSAAGAPGGGAIAGTRYHQGTFEVRSMGWFGTSDDSVGGGLDVVRRQSRVVGGDEPPRTRDSSGKSPRANAAGRTPATSSHACVGVQVEDLDPVRA
jgi:hypothetical protein